MEGLDLGQTSNPSLAWKKGRFKINDDDDEKGKFDPLDKFDPPWKIKLIFTLKWGRSVRVFNWLKLSLLTVAKSFYRLIGWRVHVFQASQVDTHAGGYPGTWQSLMEVVWPCTPLKLSCRYIPIKTKRWCLVKNTPSQRVGSRRKAIRRWKFLQQEEHVPISPCQSTVHTNFRGKAGYTWSH